MRRADKRRTRKYWQRPSSTRADKRASPEHDHHAQNNRTASRTRVHEQRIPDHIVSLRRTAPLARPSFATTCRRQPTAISRCCSRVDPATAGPLRCRSRVKSRGAALFQIARRSSASQARESSSRRMRMLSETTDQACSAANTMAGMTRPPITISRMQAEIISGVAQRTRMRRTQRSCSTAGAPFPGGGPTTR